MAPCDEHSGHHFLLDLSPFSVLRLSCDLETVTHIDKPRVFVYSQTQTRTDHQDKTKATLPHVPESGIPTEI